MKSLVKLQVALLIALLPTASLGQVAAKPGQPLSKLNVTQGFNVAWSQDKSLLHTGIDLGAKAGDPVFAVKTGTIEKKGWLGEGKVNGKTVNWGYYVLVRNDDGTVHGYLHIREFIPSLPRRINVGAPIGNVYKDHLHFNDCMQLAGCQHGAFTNPTFKDKGSKITKYYVKPKFN
jgi:murein DD-endopeptidase MepM/ murein hydrolase activator NlpD